MYVKVNRGLGDVIYDAEGMPVEDPANTTYGATSGGTCPGSPGCPGNLTPFKASSCLTPTFPWFFGTTVAGAPGVCSSTVTIPSPWNEILTFAVPALVLFGFFKRAGR